MKAIKEIEDKREAVLDQMRAIRCMKRGTINDQYLKVRHKGKKQPVLRGPYHVLSRREGNRTVSERLRNEEELQRARNYIETHKRFVSLCKEFERLTEQLGELECAAISLDVEKKRRVSRSSRTGN
jgi:ribosomal protein S10